MSETTKLGHPSIPDALNSRNDQDSSDFWGVTFWSAIWVSSWTFALFGCLHFFWYCSARSIDATMCYYTLCASEIMEIANPPEESQFSTANCKAFVRLIGENPGTHLLFSSCLVHVKHSFQSINGNQEFLGWACKTSWAFPFSWIQWDCTSTCRPMKGLTDFERDCMCFPEHTHTKFPCWNLRWWVL
jgi:hypothetical protein